MADVLIVCVREDEPQAKALADMFEAAGFSIGGAPSSDGALRSSGAGVVVWSQASIRSRPFLDAAQRVINANKAVVASLIEPPPPSSVGESPAFDLSRWDGDPNDPALDPLFFAVDRMVNAARAGVGAAPARDETAYDTRPEPPARRAPPPPPQPSYRPAPPSSDPLGSEAEHWRAIRDSRNPADFMDYLAKYGPDGSFSEVAELRLKQLTSQGDTRMPAPRAAAPQRAPRMEAPRRAEPAPRRPDPPPAAVRRPDPTPPVRRAPIFDRGFERPPTDVRDPPKGEGGPLRAFVLIALLGGAALAGGLYFGGMGGSAPPPVQEQQDAGLYGESTAPPADYDDLAEAPSVPLSEAAQPRERDRERATQTASREERATTPQREPPTPAPTTNFSTPASNNTGGPVSLSPGALAEQNTASAQIPPPLPPAIEVASNPTPQTQTPARAGSVVWTQRPSSRRITDLYPQRALREGLGGRVQLDCRVQGDLSVACAVASETPAGQGFGRAALSAAGSYRARATLSDGSSAVGSSARVAVNFQAPQ